MASEYGVVRAAVAEVGERVEGVDSALSEKADREDVEALAADLRPAIRDELAAVRGWLDACDRGADRRHGLVLRALAGLALLEAVVLAVVAL